MSLTAMIRTISSFGSLIASATFALCACGEPSGPPSATLFAAAPSAQWRLPHRLREISGLALSADGRMFAHDDERAVIYQIDVSTGEVGKSFALGQRPEQEDFEGLAITPTGDFWLVTSLGHLYRFREGDDDGHVAFERFDAGLGEACEVEGLAFLAAEDSLILACKTNQSPTMRRALTLYAWPVSERPARLWRTIPESEVAAAAGVRAFRPSSVEIDPETGRLLLLSARDAALAEFDSAGVLLAARQLETAHVQAEGMTITPDGALMIADEGEGGPALLSRYERIR